MYPGERRIGTSGPDIVKAVTVFALPKLAFDRNPLPIFLPAAALSAVSFHPDSRASFWVGAPVVCLRNGYDGVPDSCDCRVNRRRVSNNDFRVIAVAIFVSFHLRLEIMAFMLRMPMQLVDIRQFVASQSDTDFGAKFHRLAGLSSDNGSQMGLADADDASSQRLTLALYISYCW